MCRLILLYVALALGLAAHSARAADVPTPAYKVAPAAVIQTTWSGFYVGAHVGSGWGRHHWTDDGTVTAAGIVQANYKASGILGGGQVGFNVQRGPMVFGLEADGSASGIRGGGTPCYSTVVGFAQTCGTKTDWVATASGRLGWAADRALFYVKGGIAWARLRHENPCPPCAVFGAPIGLASETRTGWHVGGGLEYALSPSWSARMEYGYAEFGTERVRFFLPSGAFSFSADIRQNLHWVKLGANYRFNTPL